MNDTELIKAVAASVGYEIVRPKMSVDRSYLVTKIDGKPVSGNQWMAMPDVLNDIEAMQKMLALKNDAFNAKFASAIVKRAAAQNKYAHEMTARDWAQEFVALAIEEDENTADSQQEEK